MKRLSVAMISYHTCPLASYEGKETGGMNVYVLELSRQLGKLGVTVDMFTRSQDKKQPHSVAINHNVRLMHIPAGPEKPFPKKKLRRFIPEFVKNVSNFIIGQKLHYDLYHAHYYLSGLAATALNQKRGEHKSIIMTFHTLALMKNLVAREKSEKEDRTRIRAEHLLLKESAKLISSSASDRDYLTYLYDCPKEKIEVIAPGVDTTLFYPIDKMQAKKAIGAALTDHLILFVGRIEPLKGIDALMYAIKILHKQKPRLPVCLWIVGGDVSQKRNLWSKELQRLAALRHELGIATVVKFVGQQPQSKLPNYYSAADVVVIPSHYESFGMVALEAMACGTPVVATNVSGVTGLIDSQEEALVSSANNPLLLAAQIERLLTDKKWYRALSRELLAKVKHFTWERTAKQVAAVYTSLG